MGCCDKTSTIESNCIHPGHCWIERPKYFSGQLLTDEDLSLEQNYFREKMKLHNRHLHGWGVVCGLKVKCFPCCTGHGASGKVLVESGHAIDCCGNDIIVCNETEYDVIKRIDELKQKKKAESDPCSGEPAATEQECDCEGEGEKYYLVLRYKETEAKPATAFNSKNGCSIQSCVPSRIQECYELDLVEYCTLDKTRDENFPTKAMECITLFNDTLNRVRGTTGGKGLDSMSPAQLKDFIRQYHKALPSHTRCDVLDELDRIEIGEREGEEVERFPYSFKYDPAYDFTSQFKEATATAFSTRGISINIDDVQGPDNNNNYTIQSSDGKTYLIKFISSQDTDQGPIYNYTVYEITTGYDVSKLLILAYQLLFDCICQALINPCPECREDDLVILATITVIGKKIHSICNVTRRWVMSFPTLFYWLPINIIIKQIINLLCCTLDLRQTGSLPLWQYINKAATNNFKIPELLAANIGKSFNALPKSLFNMLNPNNISLESVLNMNEAEARKELKNKNMTYTRTIPYKPEKALSLKYILSTMPVAPINSKITLIVDKNKKVVGIKREEPKEDTAGISNRLDSLENQIMQIKSHYKRDTPTVLSTGLTVEKEYEGLAVELTTGLLKKITPEALKDVGEQREKELKKANIKSVFDVLEAVPSRVSDAVKESIANAVKYVDNAETYSLETARFIASELKKANITKKEDLEKLDVKKIAGKLKISEKKVKDCIAALQ